MAILLKALSFVIWLVIMMAIIIGGSRTYQVFEDRDRKVKVTEKTLS